MPAIYVLRDPETLEVRYIGKANDPKERLKQHMRDVSRRKYTPLYVWIRSLGKCPVMDVIEHAEDWQEAEIRHIAQYRAAGYRLLNICKGGNQPTMNSETRAELGRRNAKTVHSDPARKLLWELKKDIGLAIKAGGLTEKRKAILKAAAAKYPEAFGDWAIL